MAILAPARHGPVLQKIHPQLFYQLLAVLLFENGQSQFVPFLAPALETAVPIQEKTDGLALRFLTIPSATLLAESSVHRLDLLELTVYTLHQLAESEHE